MDRKIKEIISDIKKINPDASDKEIEEAIKDLIRPKKRGSLSRVEQYQDAKTMFKLERLQEASSKTKLVNVLTPIQEDLSDRGLKDDADRFANHIRAIEDASSTTTEKFRRAESDISEMMERGKNTEKDRARTIRKLEEWGADVDG